MNQEIEFKIDSQNQGSFFIIKEGKKIAELDFTIKNNVLNAYHTGVRKEYEGQGIAGQLFDEMVEYARENNYKVIPSCSYIAVKFKRHENKYKDIWQKTGDEPTGAACGLKK